MCVRPRPSLRWSWRSPSSRARAVWACALAAPRARARDASPVALFAAMSRRRPPPRAGDERFEPPRDPASTPSPARRVRRRRDPRVRGSDSSSRSPRLGRRRRLNRRSLLVPPSPPPPRPPRAHGRDHRRRRRGPRRAPPDASPVSTRRCSSARTTSVASGRTTTRASASLSLRDAKRHQAPHASRVRAASARPPYLGHEPGLPPVPPRLREAVRARETRPNANGGGLVRSNERRPVRAPREGKGKGNDSRCRRRGAFRTRGPN